jgi:hypothetical protein
MGLGVGRSNSPLQGSIGGTLASYNAIPYGGGHIPTPSPSLGSAFEPSVRPNMNYNLFGEGSIGPSSYTTLVGSMLFSFVMSPRPSPVVNFVYEMSCKMVYRIVSQVYLSWWAYVIISLESLSVEGQEPNVVHVSM